MIHEEPGYRIKFLFFFNFCLESFTKMKRVDNRKPNFFFFLKIRTSEEKIESIRQLSSGKICYHWRWWWWWWWWWLLAQIIFQLFVSFIQQHSFFLGEKNDEKVKIVCCRWMVFIGTWRSIGSFFFVFIKIKITITKKKKIIK